MKFLLLVLLVLFLPFTSHAIDVDKTQLLQDLKVLSADEMEGRKVETSGHAKARNYIIQRFEESGLQMYGDSYEQPFSFEYKKDKNQSKHKAVNVAGYLKGTVSNNAIVVTAHYDHIGMKDGKLYSGTNDNASGVAALFAIGRHFKQHPPHNSIILAALDAEEVDGRLGGTHLLSHIDRSAVVMNVNMDMIGRDKNNILYAAGTHHYPYLKPYLQTVAASAPVKLLFGHDQPNLRNVEDWTRDSDHYAFHLQRIPFIYFGVEDFENHHKPTDKFENMTQDFYAEAVKTILMALEEFDRNLGAIQKRK